MALAPEKIYALVVGIEQYAMPECVPLPGAGKDAVRFTDWLSGRQVPAGNIQLFLSPVPENAEVRPKELDIAVTPATRSNIYHAVFEVLPTIRGGLLFVFWGGHGVAAPGGDRHLFYADATKEHRANLAFTRFLTALLSSQYKFAQQICIVDSCATYIDDLRFDATLPVDAVSQGRPGERGGQYVLFAASDGQAAKHIVAEQTGALSREVLPLLEGDPAFPPDMEKLGNTVRTRFDELHQTGKVRQAPQVLRVVAWGAKDDTFVYGTRQEREAVGPLVGKMYDRDWQVQDFKARSAALRAKQPWAEVVLVYGEEYEAHPTLTERLLATTIRGWAEGRWGEAEGTVRHVTVREWPTHPDLQQLRNRLLIQLVGALESTALITDPAYGIVSQSPYFRRHRVLVIEHRVTLKEWHDAQGELLRWYAEEFWGRIALRDGDPHIFIFVHFVCEEEMGVRGLVGRVLGRRCPKDALADALKRVPGAIALEELPHLTADDIENWFIRYIRDLASGQLNEKDEAEAIIQGAARSKRQGYPRTDRIEQQLIKIHADWTRESGKGL